MLVNRTQQSFRSPFLTVPSHVVVVAVAAEEAAERVAERVAEQVAEPAVQRQKRRKT